MEGSLVMHSLFFLPPLSQLASRSTLGDAESPPRGSLPSADLDVSAAGSVRYDFMSSCVSVGPVAGGLCHTESHHEREGLGLRDNAGVCATAPEWRLALSDCSRFTTSLHALLR